MYLHLLGCKLSFYLYSFRQVYCVLLHLICYHARLAEPFHRMDGPCPGRRQGIYITSIYIASRQIFTPESSLRSKGYYQQMMMTKQQCVDRPNMLYTKYIRNGELGTDTIIIDISRYSQHVILLVGNDYIS